MIRLDEQRAIEVINTVKLAHGLKKKPFSFSTTNKLMHPEKLLVNVLKEKAEDDKDIAYWLFAVCMADKMVDSRKLYSEFTNYFKKTRKWVEDNLKDAALIFKKEEYNTNVNNALSIITNNYEGNIFALLPNNNARDCINTLTQFKGIGEQLAKQYLLFLSRYGIGHTEGLSPKVDRHLVRLSILTGIANVSGGVRIDTTTTKISALLDKIFTENNFDAVTLDPALWFISRYLCRERPKRCKTDCPINDYCNKKLPYFNPKSTRIYLTNPNKELIKIRDLF